MHLNCGYLELSAALFTCDEPDWMQILLPFSSLRSSFFHL